MSVPKYKGYKQSGVEWLGELPTHWEIARARRLFEIKKRIVGTLGFDVLSITQQGLKVRDLESNDGQLSMDYSKYQLVEPGDFAMNHMDLLTGYVDIARTRGVTSPDYRVFSIRHPNQCFDRYYLYLLQNCYRSKIFYAFGQGASQLGRWRLPTDQFNDFVFPEPPFHEQLQIATFLDHETTKIDTLVDEQKRLIELLKEKRQAVISGVVTKGLNPNAPMKRSNVAWMGEIPEHWKLEKVGRYFRAFKGKDGQLLTKEYCAEHTGEYPVYSGQTENEGVMGTLDRFEFDVGSDGVLFSTTVGAKAMTVKHLHGKFNLSQNCMIIRPTSDKSSVRFFFYHFHPLFQYQRNLIPEHMQASFRIEDLKQYPMALPPIDEQREIATTLDREIAKIDNLMVEADHANELLIERRNALISAAVTGGIDVRGFVSAKAEAA